MMSIRGLFIALAVTLMALPAAAQSVGVTAAVNPTSHGTPPGGGLRALALGQNVVNDERVTTDANGLVQILFVDGTTLTVGPRSDLVIDSFFYDPNKGTAQMAASMSKGVLRFIGGLTSKNPDGVAITTPVGTIGIRGGIADIVLNPPAGTPPHIDLLFGAEITLSQGQQLLSRLYQSGYSIVLGPNGAQVIKTPPEWSAQMQAALAGGPGTTGGGTQKPTNQSVADSGIPGGNSDRPPDTGLPGSVLPLTQQEIAQLLDAVTLYEELRGVVAATPQGTTYAGAVGGIVHIANYEVGGPGELNRWAPVRTTGESVATASLASITLDDNGNPLAGVLDVSVFGNLCVNCRVQIAIDATGAVATATDSTGTYTGTNVTGSLSGHAGVTLPAGVTYCACEFAHWGFWQAQGEYTASGTRTVVNVQNGTWAVGTPTSMSDLNTLGAQELSGTYATFAGHMIGSASSLTGPDYLAASNFDMRWHFADRQGEFNIDSFDGRGFFGYIASNTGEVVFTGTVSGDGTGEVRGAFVNNGATPAAGVVGDFALSDTNWNAAGVFVGARGPDGNNY